ncbi:MAG TPA: DUF3810 domain-containing protein [Caproiciproducens sp.]|nr:DUF3810 domain-containing protein [Caproiciproducens sp.]
MSKILRLKRVWLIVLMPAALVLGAVSGKNPAFAEWYALTVYPLLSIGVNFITSLFPFSLAELLVVLLPAAVILFLVIFTIKIIKNKEKRVEIFLKFLLNIICIASVTYFAFMISCGINYSRYPFAQTSGLKVQPSSKTELVNLCNSLADELNGLRQQVKTDDRSVMKLSQTNIYDTARAARDAYNRIGGEYPLLRAGYGVPKPVFFSHAMSYSNITGIFFPFTFEANVNVDIPAYSIPATMCHELSHLRGYMREDEANFIGYLVCEKSGNTDFRYSGDMLAFIYASNALYSTDGNAANQVYARLDAGVRRDLDANSAYWKQFEGPVAEASNLANDSYLKANHQEDGVKSYGRMVDLLLAEYRAKKAGR